MSQYFLCSKQALKSSEIQMSHLRVIYSLPFYHFFSSLTDLNQQISGEYQQFKLCVRLDGMIHYITCY